MAVITVLTYNKDMTLKKRAKWHCLACAKKARSSKNNPTKIIGENGRIIWKNDLYKRLEK